MFNSQNKFLNVETCIFFFYFALFLDLGEQVDAGAIFDDEINIKRGLKTVVKTNYKWMVQFFQYIGFLKYVVQFIL
jgi:hypothetical protein